ncbi:unnamed protein product, partial [Ectocarpus sp. 6 AP-2014]
SRICNPLLYPPQAIIYFNNESIRFPNIFICSCDGSASPSLRGARGFAIALRAGSVQSSRDNENNTNNTATNTNTNTTINNNINNREIAAKMLHREGRKSGGSTRTPRNKQQGRKTATLPFLARANTHPRALYPSR